MRDRVKYIKSFLLTRRCKSNCIMFQFYRCHVYRFATRLHAVVALKRHVYFQVAYNLWTFELLLVACQIKIKRVEIVKSLHCVSYDYASGFFSDQRTPRRWFWIQNPFTSYSLHMDHFYCSRQISVSVFYVISIHIHV